MPLLKKIDPRQAIPIWEALALNKVSSADISLNPGLLEFYRTYLKLEPYYFLIYHEETAVGLLPIVKDKNSFCSMPHLSHGGLFWDKGFQFKDDPDKLIAKIVSALVKEQQDSGFYKFDLKKTGEVADLEPTLEIRSQKAYFKTEATSKVLHYIDLKASFDAQQKAFSSNLRRKISRANKNGLVVKDGGKALVHDFTKVYNRNIQEIGAPTLGEDFFRMLSAFPGSNVDVFVCYHDSKPIGGGFCMWYDGYYENTWFATLGKFNNLYPSYALHEAMIKKAIQRGAGIYSLGRSTKNSGVHKYKTQWPVIEKELFFSRTVINGWSLKDQKWLSKIWSRIPKKLADSLGPFFAKRMY